MEDIQEALSLARRQGVLPPVRIARILAGEGTGQFSVGSNDGEKGKETIPLSVALEYVGSILEESRGEISRLRTEVEEYNQLCNSMETEIDDLLRASHGQGATPAADPHDTAAKLNIDDLYAKAKEGDTPVASADQHKEVFWKEMNQTEDNFETISRFFAKGVIN